jgi:hypothetical protein
MASILAQCFKVHLLRLFGFLNLSPYDYEDDPCMLSILLLISCGMYGKPDLFHRPSSPLLIHKGMIIGVVSKAKKWEVQG